MKKSQRLKIIVDLNATDEKKALEALGKAQRKKKQLQGKLDELLQYQQDYKQKFQTISEIGVNITQLLEFRAFISKLEIAIDGQKKAVLEQEEEVTFVRKTWERKHQKTKSLQKVCDTALEEEVKMEDKREQKEQDDQASSRSGRGGGTKSA
jgi:flagellar FliJ protein